MQPVDFTTLTAVCWELRATWLPARLEQVYQRDRFTLCLALRTLDQRGWLTLSWHPQAARCCMGDAPPRQPDTFTFSQQLRHQLGNLALVGIELAAPWERVVDLQFAQRPGGAILWHLYLEVMAKYSNAILVNQDNTVITAAHQVTPDQSSVRPILTGQPYAPPPALTDPIPTLTEPQSQWQERIALVPGPLRRNLLKTYRGLSSALVVSMIEAAGLRPDRPTDQLASEDWQRLFDCWQEWLSALERHQFQPGFTATGYTVLGWDVRQPVSTMQDLLNTYYTRQLNQQVFAQLHHQIGQKLKHTLEKLAVKARGFQERLHQSDQADQCRQQADLLMAHLHLWEPGMKAMILPDFETAQPITIALNPEKNGVQNAQALYRQHQKLRRARAAIEPLLAAVQTEMVYLEQVEAALAQIEAYQSPADLEALEEIRDELVQQHYLDGNHYRDRALAQEQTSQPHRYTTPNGYEILIGRNNRQNDYLTFRLATDYDLWFHAQEIPGSHVLLRLPPGTKPETTDLQFTADLTAYYSRARQSEQVPIIYTEPRHVYKPRGAKPGTVIYKQEQVIWGQPQRASLYPAVGI